MPGFDRTGPWGTGPMTGGGRGFCNPAGARRSWFGRGGARGFGRGHERGLGTGRGFGWCTWGPANHDMPYPYTPSMTREKKIDILQNQVQLLREELEDTEAKLSRLEKKEN